MRVLCKTNLLNVRFNRLFYRNELHRSLLHNDQESNIKREENKEKIQVQKDRHQYFYRERSSRLREQKSIDAQQIKNTLKESISQAKSLIIDDVITKRQQYEEKVFALNEATSTIIPPNKELLDRLSNAQS